MYVPRRRDEEGPKWKLKKFVSIIMDIIQRYSTNSVLGQMREEAPVFDLVKHQGSPPPHTHTHTVFVFMGWGVIIYASCPPGA